MIKLAICDDESYFLKHLEDSAKQYLDKQNLKVKIQKFSSGEELLNAEDSFDIILMDMKLPGKSGLEVVEQLRRDKKDSQVIFITSYQEYALEAFDLDAIHYLVKPVSGEKLFHALDKALQWGAGSERKSLAIVKGAGTQRIFLREIRYCEAIGHKIYIHTNIADYDYFGTLDSLEDKLDTCFFRCHRSYIVNLNYVISKERDMAIVSGGDKVLISRRKQQEFAQRLLAFFRKEIL